LQLLSMLAFCWKFGPRSQILVVARQSKSLLQRIVALGLLLAQATLPELDSVRHF
jgi:hypothetical protein